MRITDTSDLWWKSAIVYCLDIETFLDSNADGIGDLGGLATKIDYLAELGVNCLWLMPFYPSPDRDDGYDIVDFYGIAPRLGNHRHLGQRALPVDPEAAAAMVRHTQAHFRAAGVVAPDRLKPLGIVLEHHAVEPVRGPGPDQQSPRGELHDRAQLALAPERTGVVVVA